MKQAHTDGEIGSIRNFSIVAHIDHGKSTLADRLLEKTHTVTMRELREQILDDMDLERERGITIKARAVRLVYGASDGKNYHLNLLDTPGHVDFSYEVSRSLAACEGALLVVDGTQGIEAQTIANANLALENNLKMIPIINKIDLPNVDIEAVRFQIEEVLGLSRDDIIIASAKDGRGITDVLEAIVSKIPPPRGDRNAALRALIFDSVFDIYRGVIVYVRVYSGEVQPGMTIAAMSTGKVFDVEEVGIFRIKATPIAKLSAGEVGYVIANIKATTDVKIGDTITDLRTPAAVPLPGFKKLRPMVFAGLYPAEESDYELLKSGIERLSLNDPALVYEPESSAALGFGFRCGFLGLLHLEIVQERLRREHSITLISTAPNVVYRILNKEGEILEVDNPLNFPQAPEIEELDEPYIEAFIISPNDYIGQIMQLVQERRGACIATESIDKLRVLLTFEMPLSEVIIDFHDKLKSCTRGYASMDYEHIGFRPSEMVKLDILLNDEIADAFSIVVHKSKVYHKARFLTQKLKELVPRQLVRIAIQAAIGNKIIARETVPALKKHVTGKCYGGDITRKRKLWEKQKLGKKKMRQFGKVTVPQNVFLEVLKSE